MSGTITSERRIVVGRTAAAAAAALFAALAAFELALAAGAPWGKAAFGGGQAELTGALRVTSGAYVVLFAGFALVILRRGGHRMWVPVPLRWLPAAGWVLTGYAALGTLLNAISRSPVERAVMTPTSLTLAALCAAVAVAARPSTAMTEPR